MHESRQMSYVLYKDKMSMLLLSMHAPPIFTGNRQDRTITRHNGTRRSNISTSPILHEYTSNNMQGVNVVDHLRGNYITQVHTYKWWHRVIFFL
jgi:hypothetical protein